MRNAASGLVMVVLILVTATSLQAVIIDASVTPQGTGGILGIGDFPENWIVVYKDLNPLVGLGPVDVNITVDQPGDYWVYEKSYQSSNGFIHNNSGVCWTDFHFELFGGGTFGNGTVSTDVFASSLRTDTTIDLWNGSVPQSTDFHPSFAFNAPAAGTYTIREWATVPEPCALVLLGIGAISLLGYGWRRRR